MAVNYERGTARENTTQFPGQNPDLPTMDDKRAAAQQRVAAQNQAVRDRNPYLPPGGGTMSDGFGLPGYDQRDQFIWNQLGNGDPRAVGQYQGMGATAYNANAAQIAAAQHVNAPNLGPALQMQAAQLGPAAQGQAMFGGASQIEKLSPTQIAQIGAAQQAQDSAVRQNQMEALNYQGGLMRGENSVAALQQKRMADQAMAQQLSLRASARPGQGGMATRLAGQNMGNVQGQLARDLQLAQLQERNAAANVYGQMSGQVRGQDQNLSMFNTDAQNVNQRMQAQLSQSAYGQDSAQAAARAMEQARLGTQASLTNAQLGTQASLTNAGMTNEQARYGAGLAQDAAARNMDAGNLRQFQQGGFDMGAQQFNSAMDQGRMQAQAGLDTNVNLANAAQNNNMAQYNAGVQNDASRFNIDASLRGRGLDDARMMGLLNEGTKLAGLQQGGGIAYQNMVNQNKQNDLDRALRMRIAQMGQQDNSPSIWERLGGGLVGGLTGFALSGGNPMGALAGAGMGALGQGTNLGSLAGMNKGTQPSAAQLPFGGVDVSAFENPYYGMMQKQNWTPSWS